MKISNILIDSDPRGRMTLCFFFFFFSYSFFFFYLFFFFCFSFLSRYLLPLSSKQVK